MALVPGGPKVSLLAIDAELRQIVADKLDLEWSPEQIAVHLRATYPSQPRWHLYPETIYQTLYLPGRSGLSRRLVRKLRTGRSLRKRRRRPDRRRVRFVAGASITARPVHVEARDVPGHWEGDLIIGRNNRSAIGTLVERHSRYGSPTPFDRE